MYFLLRDGRYQISYHLCNPQTYLSFTILAFLTSLGSMSHFSVVSVGRINFNINIRAFEEVELEVANHCCCLICNSTPHGRSSTAQLLLSGLLSGVWCTTLPPLTTIIVIPIQLCTRVNLFLQNS